ncbi:secreted/surface protein with fasciclin-like repeats [Aequorivita sublithincola DSM 14238]|uniref:Secreted/surface protein with fasciclin-like repeats n=1 Tax=Aequorivita sublithincola (strain DSM 14238 / LMG 21431 / ACAM 643 / 9-3) TaxID=746697 RepID=I3YRQ4_AEQSU|nr:fasciclin domain-containing protein [Aequorivita sublithincola]AFL79672.1 secreted/surface protein with fasciclin-like repeats [Aequorivita sublithincola DSM 14238]
MKTTFKILFVAAALLVFSACKNETNTETGTSAESSTQNEAPASNQGQAFIQDDESVPNVLQIAIGSPDHSTLVAAVQAAGLENSLVNAGPLMVFAPTNAAFDALPAGTVEDLLKPENKDKLASILKHHVTPGNYSKDFLKKFKKLGQADGNDASVEVKGDDVYVGGAKIIASVPAGNGIVHVVDKVILPAN